MDDERLIELVRENSVLYDISHTKYMDTKHKIKLWNKIGAQLMTDGKKCKGRWNNIRDNYRKSLKKTHTKMGKARSNVKFYKYHEQLNFMIKHFTEGKKKGSEDSDDKDLDSHESDDEEIDQKQNFTPVYLTNESSPNRLDDSTPSPDNVAAIPYVVTLSPSHVNTASSSPTPTPTKNVPQTTEASSIFEYIIQKNQGSAEVTLHQVDAFLNGIAPTLKSLNQYNLHMAKSEIFATVQKYEMKMMKEKNYHCIQVTHPSLP